MAERTPQVILAGANEARMARDAAERGEPDACIASATGALPLLWLMLFDYEDIMIRHLGERQIFYASTSTSAAAKRARSVARRLPTTRPTLLFAARSLASAMEALPRDHYLGLSPSQLLTSFTPASSRAYLEYAINIVNVWQEVRASLSWDRAEAHFANINPEIILALDEKDETLAEYYLLGTLAERNTLNDYSLRLGQDKTDREPEALAVGDQGLVVGRFHGTWKVMESGTDADLLGVFGTGDEAYLVGRRGTVLHYREGKCTPIDVPTKQALNAIWGFEKGGACAVGDQGTVIAFDGTQWHLWPAPAREALHCVWGRSPETLWVGGQEAAILRFDGYGWVRMHLPRDAFVNEISEVHGEILAIGGSARGGEIFRLETNEWVSVAKLPPDSPWLEGLWFGWDKEFGVIPRTGAPFTSSDRKWKREAAPIEEGWAAASGSLIFAVGRRDAHTMILVRQDEFWDIEATIPHLRLNDIWSAGEPKPPKIDFSADPPDEAA